ncbi:MAG TPA: radical SAM protein, partial [Polyangia bacterium]
VGVQSFSPTVLRRMGRRGDVDAARAALLGAAGAGIPVQFDLIIGFPEESDEEFADTLGALDELLAEAPSLMVNLNPFQLVPGSDVAARPDRYGALVTPPAVSLPPTLARLAGLVPRFVGAARVEPGREEVEARSSLLAEVVYRHKAPPPVPILDEELPVCNNNCVFCGVADLRAQARVAPLAEVDRGLAALAATGEDRVMFAVSELSLRPDFVDIVAAARRRGFRAIYVVTNGRIFAYRQLAERAVAAGATHFMVSLHGPDAERHEALTRTPGSFGQTVAGIRNLVALGAGVCTNTVVCRRNLAVLDRVVDLVADLGVRYATLSQIQIIGDAARHAERLVVPLAQALPRLLAAALHGEGRGLRMGLGGVPYCLVPGHERFLGVDDLASMYNADPRDNITAKAPYVRPQVCFGCAYYAVCTGLAEEYLARYGSDELKPVAGRRETVRPPGEAVDFIVPRGGAAPTPAAHDDAARPGIGGRAPVP